MKNENILDEFESISKDNNYDLMDSVRWWEGKRIMFNLLLLFTEVVVMFYYSKGTKIYGIEDAITQTILVNLVANLFYCLGWGLEILVYYYLKGYRFSKSFRNVLYFLGVVFSVGLAYFMYSATLVFYQSFQ